MHDLEFSDIRKRYTEADANSLKMQDFDLILELGRLKNSHTMIK